eukprot:6128592-Pyramimonas_sp.AAC.1
MHGPTTMWEQWTRARHLQRKRTGSRCSCELRASVLNSPGIWTRVTVYSLQILSKSSLLAWAISRGFAVPTYRTGAH